MKLTCGKKMALVLLEVRLHKEIPHPCAPPKWRPRGVTSWARLSREETGDWVCTAWGFPSLPVPWLQRPQVWNKGVPFQGLSSKQNPPGPAWLLASGRSHICTSCSGFWGVACKDPLVLCTPCSLLVCTRLPPPALSVTPGLWMPPLEPSSAVSRITGTISMGWSEDYDLR